LLDSVEKLKLGINGMEIFGARPEEPIQTCIDEVEKSQIFIGIIGMRFGSVHPETGKSFVQIEYETAIDKKLDTLIYFIDEENALIKPNLVDIGENAKKLKEFKEYLKQRHTVETFIDPNDLVKKFERDITRLLKDRGYEVNEFKFEPVSDEAATVESIIKFNLMPKLENGTEIEIIVEFSGSPDSVDKQVCEALNLTYGASISRAIKVISPKEVEGVPFLRKLFAQDAQCEFIYKSDSKKPYKIIAKLSFGISKSIRFHQSSRYRLNTEFIHDVNTGQKIANYVHAVESSEKGLIFIKEA
jgi:hypothetical protein